MSIKQNYISVKESLPESITLVAISKTYPIDDLMQAYDAGAREFGENRHSEMVQKYNALPKDIVWHFIGHLQTNKVKYIAPFVNLIHSVDSDRLLAEISSQGIKNGRVIDVLMELHVAQEESKSGWAAEDLIQYIKGETFKQYSGIRIRGVMAMGSYGVSEAQIKAEFSKTTETFNLVKTIIPHIDIISMGMSADYKIAINCGSNMVRIGSTIFGSRNYSK